MTPVILLHGWGGTYAATYRAAGWEPFLRARGLEPIGVDLPGHRGAGCSHDPADYADLADELAAALPKRAKRCIAFSLGAKIALEVELRSPGRFERMVLGGVGDNLFAPERVGPALVEALLGERVLADCPVLVQDLMRYVKKGDTDPRSIAAVVQRPHNPKHAPERLAHLGPPTLLVNGADDTAARPDDKFRAAVPNLEYRLLQDCDHIGLTNDVRFMQAAAQFLGEVF